MAGQESIAQAGAAQESIAAAGAQLQWPGINCSGRGSIAAAGNQLQWLGLNCSSQESRMQPEKPGKLGKPEATRKAEGSWES